VENKIEAQCLKHLVDLLTSSTDCVYHVGTENFYFDSSLNPNDLRS